MDAVTEYYVNQAGTGIPGFQGIRYQRGQGFFSSLWSRIGLPVLKFLGKQAVDSGLSVASDALEGKNLKDSAMTHLRSGGKRTVDFLRNMNDQSGSGRKRRRKSIKKVKRLKKTPVVKKKRKQKLRKRKSKRRTRKLFNF